MAKPWNYRETPGCGKPGHDTDHYSSSGKKSCRECHLARGRKYAKARHARRRAAAILAYGGACQCCGETELVFLAIDHVDGGGNQHRKEIGASGSTTIYRWLEANDYPEGFQVLCHNCNYARSQPCGCPHQTP